MRPDLIKEEAERRHDSACANGAACGVKDQHLCVFIIRVQHERIAELAELNRRLANQVVGYSDRAQEAISPKLAAAWDEGYGAAADGAAGKPPNPYRQGANQ